MNDLIRVLLCDDHKLFLEGLRKLLELDKEIKIIGEAINGLEAVEKARQLNPDVILMDISLPQMDGVRATRKIKSENPRINIIILTMYDDDKYIFEAIKAGAIGYLLKDTSSDEVTQAIHTIYKGGGLIQPKIAGKILKEFSALSSKKHELPDDTFNALTDREDQVLRLICEGDRNKKIATELGISEKTVKNHIVNIYQKLQVNTRTQAILQAIRSGKVNI